MIYLDNSATTQVAPEVLCAVQEQLQTTFANPSSRHHAGLESEKAVARWRETVAAAMGVTAAEVYFTSGGTESDNIAVFGGANLKKGKRVVTTAIEHPAVARCMDQLEAQGYDVVRLMPRADGSIPLDAFREAITADTCLVSVMLVNNETGAILPVDKLKPLMQKRAPRALLHTDAVQAFGHVPLVPARWGVDLASVSGHKVHAIKGIGALYVRKGAALHSPVFGGGQERGVRSGTENLTGICALAAACTLFQSADHVRTAALKAQLLDAVLALPDTCHNGGGAESPYILNVSFGGIRSEVMLNALSARGIYVSSGSACSAVRPQPSPVLTAMGAPMTDNAIRFSFSRYTTAAEIATVTQALSELVKELRR